MARKPKLSKSEKIERDIRLNLRKQERAVEMQAKATKMLRTSAQAFAQLHKRQRRLEAKTADELVKTQVESPLSDFVERGQAAQKAVDTIVEARDKRMKAMGFRKTGKRKTVATDVESK